MTVRVFRFACAGNALTLFGHLGNLDDLREIQLATRNRLERDVKHLQNSLETVARDYFSGDFAFLDSSRILASLSHRVLPGSAMMLSSLRKRFSAPATGKRSKSSKKPSLSLQVKEARKELDQLGKALAKCCETLSDIAQDFRHQANSSSLNLDCISISENEASAGVVEGLRSAQLQPFEKSAELLKAASKVFKGANARAQ
mmetsp:Transcript_9584/g.28971  ORF Transcript_9584/g.28971 Transcript_9584/m.28971 type:complete len:201 (-) Transcript_9584:2060-2662(-)